MLTDLACRTAQCDPGKSKQRHYDAGSLYLEVSAQGSKRWFWKYRFADKEKRLALGAYPEVSLKQARLDRDAARLVLTSGADPAIKRRVEKITALKSASTTYEQVAREMHSVKAHDWSATHAKQWLRCQEKDLFPWIGGLPIAEITAPVLLATLRRVEARGATQIAHDLREFSGQVFRYAIVSGKALSNPAADLRDALRPHTVKHAAAITDPAAAGQLMRAISLYQGQPGTRAALRLSALIFQRPGNVRMLEWAWIDGDMLRIPSASMKRKKAGKLNGRPHLVPLSKQAQELLADQRRLTGHCAYVFPSVRSDERPMSENTINAALRGLGYGKDDMTAHGFRAMARTIIKESMGGFEADVIEAQLGHSKGGPLGEAYDRAEYLALRRQMMQAWADYLGALAG